MLKGLPLAYNKDMQEDKEAIFDAFDTARLCLTVYAPMIATMKVNAENMLAAARGGVHQRHGFGRLSRQKGCTLPHGLQAHGANCRRMYEKRQVA